MANVAVFGGSGRLGEAVVRRLAQNHRVRFAYHASAEPAARLAAELIAAGHDVAARQVDVRDAMAVDAFFSETAGAEGLGGVVSANGGPFPIGPFHDLDVADFRRLVELDLIGTFHIMQSATRLMAETGGGSIVIFLTAAILRTAVLDGASAVPKAALAAMIRQLARDAGPLNVRCNGIAPGIIDTDKVADIKGMPHYARKMVENFFDDTVLGRFTSLDTVAGLTQFLLSHDAADISGQIIAADGGYSA